MLAIIPGMIAGSALTKSANQIPNVGTQVTSTYCAYKIGGFRNWDWGRFGECMADMWVPFIAYTSAGAPFIVRAIRSFASAVRVGAFVGGIGFAVA
jgi:hypothetical protein